MTRNDSCKIILCCPPSVMAVDDKKVCLSRKLCAWILVTTALTTSIIYSTLQYRGSSFIEIPGSDHDFIEVQYLNYTSSVSPQKPPDLLLDYKPFGYGTHSNGSAGNESISSNLNKSSEISTVTSMHVTSWIPLQEKLARLPEWNRHIDSIMPTLRNDCEKMSVAKEKANKLPRCPCFSSKNEGFVEPDLSPPSWKELAKKFGKLGVQPGGHYKPPDCAPRSRIIIVFPYRDREQHLHIVINHLHNVLTRQGIEYQIIVVEQAYPAIFNRAALINIGFLEGMSLNPHSDCVVFHDVDYMTEDDRNLYGCFDQPRHMAHSADRYKYTQPYSTYFGGVNSFRPDTFTQINGFGTNFWGWGGEDDVMEIRINLMGLSIVRQDSVISRMAVIKHEQDTLNPYNVHKPFGKSDDIKRKRLVDGVGSQKYHYWSLAVRPLYTWLYKEPLSPLSHFHQQQHVSCHTAFSHRGQDITVDKCAQKCLDSHKCTQFTFSYHSMQSTTCLIHHGERCTLVAADNSFVYTKGRTVPPNSRRRTK